VTGVEHTIVACGRGRDDDRGVSSMKMQFGYVGLEVKDGTRRTLPMSSVVDRPSLS